MTDLLAYHYQIEGSAAQGQTWQTSGEVVVIGAGSFTVAVEKAMRDSFMKLTAGAAVYGRPGEGCIGPYRVTKFILTDTDARV